MVEAANEDSDFDDDYEKDVDDETHKRLINNILSLNKGKEVKKPVRTEPALEVSEYNLVKSGTGHKGSVHVTDLTKVLKSKANHIELGKKVKNVEKRARTLEKPLERPQAEKIKRTIAYENVKKQFDKWDPVVSSNRTANTLCFPLQYDTRLEDKVLARTPYRIKSDLQKKLDELEPKQEVIHVDMAFEEENKPLLTMDELMEKRKEAAKLRAHQSYKEAKARRQNKIKSKKYHRIQRKERIKLQMQEFEILQKTNPEAALKKLEEIEKARAEERLTLRHKSTGQWARSKQVRAKYDKESRQALAQQLSISKELTQKLKAKKDSDSEDEQAENEEIIINGNDNGEDNPWAKIKPTKEVTDFVSGYRKYWENQNKENDVMDNKNEVKEESEESDMEDELEDFTEQIKQMQNGTTKAEKNIEVKPKENGKTAGKRKEDIVEVKKGTKNKRKIDGVTPEKNSKKSPIKKAKKQTSKVDLLTVSSTSDWDVSTTVQETDGDDIDKIIDSLEPKLQKKISEKLKAANKAAKSKKSKKNKPILAKDEKPKIDLRLYKEAKRPEIDEALQEGDSNDEEEESATEGLKKLQAILEEPITNQAKPVKPVEEKLDPNKILNLKPAPLDTELPDLTSYDDNDEENDTRGIICEAFEDDEIVDEFNKDKQEDIDKNNPKDINLHLPGWGSWGGHNIKENKKRKKRFIIKLPKKLPRRDDNKGNLTLNENADVSLKTHLVSDLPFPFKSVKDFEASVRAPIGNTFVPETAFRKLTQPAVSTRLGTIIEPISDDILLKKMKKRA